jgi:hypothetical protein
MIIPNSFKEAQKRVFQDKTITVFAETTTQDAEGGLVKSHTEQSTFQANVHLVSDMVKAEMYGLTENRDIQVVSSDSITLERDALIGYSNDLYRVTGIEHKDSHTVLFCKRDEA